MTRNSNLLFKDEKDKHRIDDALNERLAENSTAEDMALARHYAMLHVRRMDQERLVHGGVYNMFGQDLETELVRAQTVQATYVQECAEFRALLAELGKHALQIEAGRAADQVFRQLVAGHDRREQQHADDRAASGRFRRPRGFDPWR